MIKCLPSVEDLNRLLHYDQNSGLLYWKSRNIDDCFDEKQMKIWNSAHAGKEAGSIYNQPSGKKYKVITIKYEHFYQHRIIYKMITGEEHEQIDHLNGNGIDNRFNNLAASNILDNKKNIKRLRINKSGVSGVDWRSNRKCWRARIQVGKRQINLGHFKIFEDAVSARKIAEKHFNFKDGHGSDRPL